VQVVVGAFSVVGLVESGFLGFLVNPKADGDLGDAKCDQGGDPAPGYGDQD